jgi:hypothetical protein
MRKRPRRSYLKLNSDIGKPESGLFKRSEEPQQPVESFHNSCSPSKHFNKPAQTGMH